jgi:putative sterol carrier protein
MPETQSVEQTFTDMQEKFRSDKAQGLNATFQFNITGDGGGEYNAVITDGQAQVQPGTAASPNVTITASSDDWTKIVSGQMNPQMAFMTGKLKVQGDLGLATRLQSLFL